MRRPLFRAVSFIALASGLAGCTLMSTASEEREIAGKADAFKDVRPAADNRDQVAFGAEPYFGSRVVRGDHGEALPAQARMTDWRGHFLMQRLRFSEFATR